LIAARYAELVSAGTVPIGIGGDHSITLGELRGVSKVLGPVALVHLDAHCDTWDNYWGLRYTPRDSVPAGGGGNLLDPKHSIQVGMRGANTRLVTSMSRGAWASR